MLINCCSQVQKTPPETAYRIDCGSLGIFLTEASDQRVEGGLSIDINNTFR